MATVGTCSAGISLFFFQRNGVGLGHVFDIISDSRLDIIEHLDIKGHADVGIIVGRSLRLNNQLGTATMVMSLVLGVRIKVLLLSVAAAEIAPLAASGGLSAADGNILCP